MRSVLKPDKISANPIDRLHPKMLPLINDPDTQYDVHCHVFNFESVPKKYLFLSLPIGFRKHYNFLKKLERFLRNYEKDSTTDGAERLANFLKFGNHKTVEEIARHLFSFYPSKTIFTPLMMDMEWGLNSAPYVPYLKQIEDMKKLRNEKFSEKLLNFIALDPNNPKVYEIFQNALSNDGGFFGVKLYPALGFLPSNKKLMDIFEICQDKNIPITTHVGGDSIHTTQRFIKVYGKQMTSPATVGERYVRIPHLIRMSGKRTGEIFNSPKNWEPVLHTFPKLKLNLGHFGGTAEWVKFLKNISPRVLQIIDLMSRYEHVYSDFSDNFDVPEVMYKFRNLLETNTLVRERAMHGSDFYMTMLSSDFKTVKAQFETIMGENFMNIISKQNPKKFLFDRAVE